MKEDRVNTSSVRRFITSVVTFLVVMVFLIGCSSQSTATASCAFVVGDGREGNDTKLHTIIYPGQRQPYNSREVVTYVPCNSRNFIINDGTVKNANNEIVGDRGTPILATTKTGVSISIHARALWTLNQSQAAMAAFYNVCFKYQCASSKDVGGDANFSTKGWNGMLAENFGPTMDSAARRAAIQVDDSIWQRQDPEQYEVLENAMSAAFADIMRANLGYPYDLFCGSGNSTWSDPNKPGEGTASAY